MTNFMSVKHKGFYKSESRSRCYQLHTALSQLVFSYGAEPFPNSTSTQNIGACSLSALWQNILHKIMCHHLVQGVLLYERMGNYGEGLRHSLLFKGDPCLNHILSWMIPRFPLTLTDSEFHFCYNSEFHETFLKSGFNLLLSYLPNSNNIPVSGLTVTSWSPAELPLLIQ